MPRQFERPYLALLTVAALWTTFNCVYVYFVAGETLSYRIESAALILGVLAVPLLWSRAAGLNLDTRADATLGDRLGFAAIAVIWLAILGPLVWFPFLSDDYSFLASYRSFSAVLTPFQFYRPVFAVVFVLLTRLGGGSPFLFHAVAFALHGASAWLVYRLARRLSRGPGLVAAAVFLLNPAQLEAVLWASGLQEVLWSFFLLAALVVYVGREELTAPRLGGVAALIAAALWSKETAICVVLLLPIVEVLAFGFRRARVAVAAWLVTALECAVYLALRSRVATIDDGFLVAPSHYFFKQLLVIPYEVFIHPWNRAAVNVPAPVLCATALVVIALVCVSLWRGAMRNALAGPALIVASVLPVYSLFYVSPELAGARYLYFGAAGFGLFVAELCGRTAAATRLVATTVIAVFFSASLALNLRPWRAAADLVDAIQEAIVAGESAGPSIETWKATHAPGLARTGEIPDSYQGVWVFRNGYEAFVARSKEGNH